MAKSFYLRFVETVKEDDIVEDGMLEKFPEFSGFKYREIYKKHEPVFTELVNKVLIRRIISEMPVDAEISAHRDFAEKGYPTYTPQHEYFRIDCTGYQHRFWMIDELSARVSELNRHFWDLKIAVEHENNKRDWMDEVIKLVHVRCPLKVVITYNYCDHRDYREDDPVCDQKRLDFVAKWMVQVKAFDAGAGEEYLVIIGNGEGRRNKDYQDFDYRGYLFDYSEERFKPLS